MARGRRYRARGPLFRELGEESREDHAGPEALVSRTGSDAAGVPSQGSCRDVDEMGAGEGGLR